MQHTASIPEYDAIPQKSPSVLTLPLLTREKMGEISKGPESSMLIITLSLKHAAQFHGWEVQMLWYSRNTKQPNLIPVNNCV